MVEVRVYSCGCVDHHDAELISSSCVDHCPEHAWTGDELTAADANPAACEGVEYKVIAFVE